MNRSTRIVLIAAALSSGLAIGETTATSTTPSTTSPGQARVAAKFSAPFATLAGSTENAAALATALRTGAPVTLTYTTIAADGGASTTTSITITPPTKPMGWGNVSHSLALAQFSLTQQGITNPTGAQLQAALVGGTVTGADGADVVLTGVLQQRASGMGWGTIAQSYGTTMGAVNRSIKSPPTTATAASPSTQTSTTSAVNSTSRTTSGVTTAAGATTAVSGSSRGVTTAAGTTTQSNAHASKGLSSAAATPAAGHGIVTAAGGTVVASPHVTHGNSSAGVVTAAGASTPQGSHKGGNGKGKGGG